MSNNDLLSLVLAIGCFSFIGGALVMEEYCESTAIEAKVAYYDPVTAEFKYKGE